MNRDKFCILLAKHISEIQNVKICPTKVSEQLLLLQLGQEPTDELIATYIKANSTTKTT
jgi:hypothetical protein